ncbi:hypothetical protein M5X06_22330 [Paenibacillus alvei]|uniref:Uncharacterized protein n=1 Tax=Paenibacillus alvei TaxID=44250 RepID=A0ABT4H333_PAEAL|nr:hypothetical protein [Paenibacillus alvei]MCY9763183.1 hypothetical protein [Paenibacillus alvei]MCY9769528.1 hypothetical protein [Paenibacillus alvei]
MLTNAIYSSLVGTHFSSTEFKVTCALIDQRIANNLPSLELRKNLLQSLQQEKKSGKYLDAKQLKAIQRVDRDIQSYYEEEKVVLDCSFLGIERFTLDLNLNQVQWSDGRFGSISYGAIYSGEELIRTIGMVGEDAPTIVQENIIECSDQSILDIIFSISDFERRATLEKAGRKHARGSV